MAISILRETASRTTCPTVSTGYGASNVLVVVMVMVCFSSHCGQAEANDTQLMPFSALVVR